MRDLSNNKEFASLLKSKFGLMNFAFLILNKIIEKANKTKLKMIIFVSFIALKSDNISKFKTISAKNEIKITKKFPLKQAIK